MIRLTWLLLTATLACGCSTRPATPATAPQLELDALPPYTTDARQCPLVLYTRESPSRRIAIALDTPALLMLQSGARALHLPRKAASGDGVFNHFPHQSYGDEAGASASLDLELSPLPTGERGATVRSGSLAFTNVTGETHILPVVGLLTCGPQAAIARAAP